jgi:hypothetical protein
MSKERLSVTTCDEPDCGVVLGPVSGVVNHKQYCLTHYREHQENDKEDHTERRALEAELKAYRKENKIVERRANKVVNDDDDANGAKRLLSVAEVAGATEDGGRFQDEDVLDMRQDDTESSRDARTSRVRHTQRRPTASVSMRRVPRARHDSR